VLLTDAEAATVLAGNGADALERRSHATNRRTLFYVRTRAATDLVRRPRADGGARAVLGRARSRTGALDAECDGIESRLDVVVAAEPDAEYRELTLTNRGRTTRRLDVTTYLEVTLNDQMLDALHPAFSKLFIQTEAFASSGTLLARRRRRGPDEPSRWMGHRLLALETARTPPSSRPIAPGSSAGAHVEDPAALDRASACRERRATF
jgi:hypothetical protein